MVSSGTGMAQILIGLSSLVFLLLECALVFVIARNLSISKWMTVALFGTIISLSGGVVQQVFPWIFPRITSGSMTEYLALIFMAHLIGKACFLVGLTGAFADVRNQFRITAAMMNKPTGVDDVR